MNIDSTAAMVSLKKGIRIMKKRKILFLFAFLLLIVLSRVTITIANNSIAAGLEKQLVKCPLPPDTRILDSISIAGKMEGNGNGMQWFGAMLVESELDEEALRAWYENQIPDAEYILVCRQETPYVFEYRDYTFDNFDASQKCYMIRLEKYSICGCEDSLWEAFLNSDIRGH